MIPANQLENLRTLLRARIEAFCTDHPTSTPEIRAKIDIQLDYIEHARNGTNLLHHYVIIEHLLMGEANIALAAFSQTYNRNQSLMAQRMSPQLRRAINYSNFIARLNDIIVNNIDIDCITDANRRIEIEGQLLNRHQHRTAIHPIAFRKITEIVGFMYPNQHNDVHIYFMKSIFWSMEKTLFYHTKDNRFFNLFATLANTLKQNSLQPRIPIRLSPFSPDYQSFAAVAMGDPMELEQARALPATHFNLTSEQEKILSEKNNWLREQNIDDEYLISQDFYARLLNVVSSTGVRTALVYSSRTQAEPTILEISKALFAGEILMNHNGTLSYYPAAIIMGHEYVHLDDFRRGRDVDNVNVPPPANNPLYARVWDNSPAELLANFGHPYYSEIDLFYSMGLPATFKPRAFYNQPFIPFIAFEYNAYPREERTIAGMMTIFRDLRPDNRLTCNIS